MLKLYEKLPQTPGVYLMKDARGRVLYVGKAGNLRRRVSSYFVKAPASLSPAPTRRKRGARRRGEHDSRIENLINKVRKIDHRKTDTALEALILEAELIKKLSPPFNVKEKDDKSFLYMEITRDDFPRVLLTRGKDIQGGKSRRFGPFTSASNAREALRILRKMFPWSFHDPRKPVKTGRPCFDYEIGLCPGICVGRAVRTDYIGNIRKLMMFLEGKKKQLIVGVKREMARASENLDFEKAEKLRRQLFALQHIQDIALISDDKFQITGMESQVGERIEGYDISNISGTSAVGSMVVFIGDKPEKSEYRKFKIKTVTGSDDVGMIREVLRRRFKNSWPLPDLILIDGGRGQVNAARNVLLGFSLRIPVVGIAKGPKRRKNEFVGRMPDGVRKKTLIAVRDEAHRFAVKYHKEVRNRSFLG
ncbi:MAG: UvrB/UvrC motif-containing protein [Patescibacteria group bacterium]